MPRQLTSSQLAQYLRDGFVFPIAAMSCERARHYRQCLESYEAASGAKVSARELHVP